MDEPDSHLRLEGYDARIDLLRRQQFHRLNEQNVIYLDFAGAGLYTDQQVDDHSQRLRSRVLCNPHSGGVIGTHLNDDIDTIREEILHLFGTNSSEHVLVFTSGTTAALKLVGETFDWSPQSSFVYTRLNHNSVLGIREFAIQERASVHCIDLLDVEEIQYSVLFSGSAADDAPGCVNHLFALPAECNFSGLRPPFSLINRARDGEFQPSKGRCAVLLDAARFCSTSRLDLSVCKADFTVVSFYKMFGLPTGVGALIVRREALSLLCRKRYFGGGTLDMSVSDRNLHRLREEFSARHEDGTIAYSSILSIRDGLRLFRDQLGYDSISSHTKAITAFVAHKMEGMRHSNGVRVFQIFGRHFRPAGSKGYDQGATIAFCCRSSTGLIIGHTIISRLAASAGIQIRSGRFCNPGAAQRFLSLSADDLAAMYDDGHVCGDERDFHHGKATGAVRISFGYASTMSDVFKWLSFLQTHLVEEVVAAPTPLPPPGVDTVRISRLCLYPLKSCAAFNVQSWPLTKTSGLQFDREFAVLDYRGRMLTLKNCADLYVISPAILLKSRELELRCASMESLRVSLDESFWGSNVRREVTVCGSKCTTIEAPTSCSHWLSRALGRQCTLVRFQTSISQSNSCRRDPDLKGFSNEAQLLLISESSLSCIGMLDKLSNFRANVSISGAGAFAEESCSKLRLGGCLFSVRRRCTRCAVVDVDPDTAEKRQQVFTDLVRKRKSSKFGILISRIDETESARLSVGDVVELLS